MKKALLIVGLALMVAAGGVVYAAWQDTLTINASIGAGTLGMSWVNEVTDDNGLLDDVTGTDNGFDPTNMRRSGGYVGGSVVRETRDVGLCQVWVDGNGDLTIGISNAYPGYTCSVFAAAKNSGTVPVMVAGGDIAVTKAGYGAGTVTCEPDQDSGGASGCGYVPFAARFGGDVEFTFDFADGIACWSGGLLAPNATNGLIMWFQVEDAAAQTATYTVTSHTDFVLWSDWNSSLCTYNGVTP